ncbi:hypothetical protein BSKO_13620 [Bryopsis sp. KO-2023]|nr:hypothetical protein BSKO_13620 [Bryopsis sp. KO-2023]
MLSKLKRKFHAVKYLCSIQFLSLEPWPQDDKPISIFWQRGNKKSKRGKTEPAYPQDVAGNKKLAVVPVNQSMQVSATLYAASSKLKQTGPYQKKEIKLYIMQMTEEGEMFALLGNATINLADIAGPQETLLEIPIDCDHEIVRAVGKPKLMVACRGWYKGSGGPGSMSSTTSAMSAMSGFTEENGTHSDLSSMSSDPASHQPKKKLGVLTTEQATSLEGFDGRSGQLHSIMEVLSPRPDSDLNDSANSITADDAKEEIEETNEKETNDDVESAEGSMSPHTLHRLNTITEETADPEPEKPVEEPIAVTNTEDGPQKGTDGGQVDQEAHFAETLEDRWTGFGGMKKKGQNSQEMMLGKAITEWWTSVVSLMTCIPQPPKED